MIAYRIAAPDLLLPAMRLSLLQGGAWLAGRIAPDGPIAGERCLSYAHKAVWGMYAGGVDHAAIARVLDWVEHEALRPNGDFYFDEEPPEYKDTQRVYRTLTFGKVAVWIGHPVMDPVGSRGRRQQVLDRIMQYQHASGGVFNYIGDDPRRPEPRPTLGTLNTTFFGQLMLALDWREPALAAGRWVLGWVTANRPHMAEGLLYTNLTLDGALVTDIGPGERYGKVVDLVAPRQEFWQVGTAMAYLVDLYEAMVTRWDFAEREARPYLDAALALLNFETRMPLETYLWGSKCKVGWGAGEMLRVLVQRGGVDPTWVEQAYRVAERVAIFTFLENQLPDGGFPALHYPLRDDCPELGFCYRPLKGLVRVPRAKVPGSATIFLPAEEIAGEFLGELKPVEQGVAAWLAG
jgi:hypothetical protein